MSKKVLISIFLLLSICSNFALTSIVQAQPAGPPTPTPTIASAPTNLTALQQKFASNPNLSQVTNNEVNTSLLVQAAESNANSFSWLASILDWATTSASNEISQGIQYFWNTTLKDFFVNVGAILQQYIKQVIMYVVEPIVQVLTSILVEYAYNPDVSVGQDNFSQQVQLLAKWVRDISNDLLLLFFILSIWRYWANAAWKGGSMMGAVARIIVAAGATTAWPTIYHYVILISNSLTEYLISKNVLNAESISDAVAGAISKIVTGGASFDFINSLLSSGHVGQALTLTIPIVIAEFCLVAALGLAIISSIVVFFTMKVIQLIIVIAAFVFGPFFLCLLVSSDTDSTASSFIRAFIETSLWSFVWTIFLMLFVFALQTQSGADATGTLSATATTVTQNTQNPWFILFLELGILQAMIQTPGYLSRGKISEAGQFLELFALWKMGTGLANHLFGAEGSISKAFRYVKRSPYNPFRNKNESSTSLGGAGALPTGQGQQLTSLKNANQTGAATVGALGGGANLGGFGGVGGAGRGPVAASVARAQQVASMAMGWGSAGGSPGGGPAGSAGGAGGTIGGGGIITGNIASGTSSAGWGGSSSGLGTIAGSMRSSVGQFGTSLDGGAPAVQKTSIGLQSDPNPWHDTRGRRMNPVDYLAAYNLKSIRPGNVDLSENKKNPNENVIDFDDAGQIQKLKHRKGASASEIGMMSTVAALATLPYSDGKGHNDPRAVSATNSAVKDAGKWDPPIGRKISWALSRGKVPEYVRNLEKDRLEREKVKARISGAAAYVRGESGNAYTRFLEWKFGEKMSDNTLGMLAYTSENTDATLGGFNLNWDSGIQRLGRMGMDINPVTMGIASHEGVIAMKPSEQPQAIPAVLQLVNSHLATMGIDPSNTQIWNSSGIHWAAADGVLRGLTPQHIRAARAIGDIAGLQYVTPQYVNHIMAQHQASGQGEMAPAYEKVVLADLGRAQPFQTRRP